MPQTPRTEGCPQVMSGTSPTRSPLPTNHGSDTDQWLLRLPEYSRSLLRIKVPVTVTLATSKQTIGTITELVPGSIVQFDKLCDETLSLEVGGQTVAVGETVKVGDKFGLRLTSMATPGERFRTVRGSTEGLPQHPRSTTGS